MGKIKKDKVRSKNKPKASPLTSPTQGDEYKVGSLSSLIFESCGLSKPKKAGKNKKLVALFAEGKATTTGPVIVPPVAEPLPTPDIRQDEEVEVPVASAPELTRKPKKPLDKKKERTERQKPQPQAKVEKGFRKTGKVKATSPVKKPAPQTTQHDDGVVDQSAPDSNLNSADNRKTTTTLMEQNAPKEKNPDLEKRTIFVGNVPKEVTKKQLLKFFKTLGGSIETIRLRCAAPDKPTKLKKVAMNRKEIHPDRATVVAYIRFSSRDEAEVVVDKVKNDGLQLLNNYLVVDMADSSIKKDNKRAVFIGNLQLKVQDNELWEFFSDCGRIESVRVIRDRMSGLGKGFGYINFAEQASVEAALKKDGTDFKNRPLRVSKCVKKLKKADTGSTAANGIGSKHGNKQFVDASRPGKTSGKYDNTTDNKKKVSQGMRQRKDTTQFKGTFTAESGKLKQRPKRPNREEAKRARVAEQLSGKSLTKQEYKSKKKEMRKLSKPRWRNKGKQ